MKKAFYIIILGLFVTLYMGCNEDDVYDLDRPAVPSSLSASKGDTSVFLAWNKVDNCAGYVLVRGLSIIAEGLTVTDYVDHYAPDTLVEYRVYSINEKGWRSITFASDSGYLGLPEGIKPRVPGFITATSDNYLGCEVNWESGRFAEYYNIYKDGTLYNEKVIGTSFFDRKASVDEVEYEVYSVNRNGISDKGVTVTGRKAWFFNDTFETFGNDYVIEPYTFVADRIAYYTEGNPTVTTDEAYSGTNSLRVRNGKVQLLCDWGGAFYEGYYVVCFRAKKADGTFAVWTNFEGIDETQQATGDWKYYEYRTGLIPEGGTFNLTIQPDLNSPVYIDDFSIEYQSPQE